MDSIAALFFPPSISCNTDCQAKNGTVAGRSALAEDPTELEIDGTTTPRANSRGPHDRGVMRYAADANLPLTGIPLRVGEVLYMHSGERTQFATAMLTLYHNGFHIRSHGAAEVSADFKEASISWSPFCLVQACRLHSMEADLATPSLRLFKVSLFHHGSTHFFAIEGEDAEIERTRWVADVARALRIFTQSLFEFTGIHVHPVPGCPSTGTRILAGYMLKRERNDVLLVYGELHAQSDGVAEFLVYEDETCTKIIQRGGLEFGTSVTEHIGVDCSCFTMDNQHYAVRSSMEKVIWLRAISNLKVKMRHSLENPSPMDLEAYRSSVLECIRSIPEPDDSMRQKHLLPRRQKNTGMIRAGGDSDIPTSGGDSATHKADRDGDAQADHERGEKIPNIATQLLQADQGGGAQADHENGEKNSNIISLGELP
jgi:hypothetical protein